MQKKTVLRGILLGLIVIWMLLVFMLSNQPADNSSSLSRGLIQKFTSDEEVIDNLEPVIRKIAHLTEYACGGILFLALFLTYDVSDEKRMLFAFLIGVEYAALDEIHQRFIEGRTGCVMDVGIDAIGIAIGICICMIGYQLYKRYAITSRKE